jgi:hypothetical protein
VSLTGIRVAPGWLALREPADAAARSTVMAARLDAVLPRDRAVEIHDLGGGSGAMGRWLAPRLAGRSQRWVLHDRDPELLALAVARPPAAPGVAVEARHGDVTALDAEDVAGADLIVASALLDLLTPAELAAMLASCTAAGCPVLLALSVAGRVALAPVEPLDVAVMAAFNAHQRRDAGTGRLLGPDAVAAAVALLGGGGAELVVRPSPWRLGAAHAALAAAWLEGWVGAAGEQEPGLAGELGPYLARRRAQAAAGELAVVVDHADLLVLP